MHSYFSLQTKRLFQNKLIQLWLIVTAIIVIQHQLTTTIKAGPWNPHLTAYHYMIGFDTTSLSSTYYLIFPIIAGLIGVSLISDRKYNSSEIFEQVRLGRTPYIKQNELIAFIIGGLLTALPYLVDSLIAFCRAEAISVDRFTSMGQPIIPEANLFSLFLHLPILYWLLYFLLLVIFSGFYTVFSFDLYLLYHKKALAAVIPYLFFLLQWLFFGLLNFSDAAPSVFLIPALGYHAEIIAIFIGNILVYTGLTFFLQWVVIRDDAL